MTIYLNGLIYTLDPARPRVEAVACEYGRVVALGRSYELQALARSPADIVDLQGRTAIPGLIDAHFHLLSLGLALGWVELGDAATLAECVERVARRVQETEPGCWIMGRGWNQNEWTEGRWPTRADLDAVVDDRPVVLNSKDGHLLWVNTAALAAAGMTRDTSDPPGGEIARDEHGEPRGVLKENATQAVYAVLPPPSDDEIDAALIRAMDHALRLGLVGIGNFEGPEVQRAFGRLRTRGRLRLRVVQHIAHAALDAALGAGMFSGLGDEWLRVGSLKLFADGTLGSQTAAMLEPFTGSADNDGIATLSYEEIHGAASRAASGGVATAIHAIGDRANREALRALAAVPRVPAVPHRIEHAQLLHPDDVPLFAEHGIVASMQPIHAVGDRDTADHHWGARCATAYAWRSLRDGGATLAFGSDAPVETCDPLAGLYAAVTRHGRGDNRSPWYPEQAVSIQDALWAYTMGAATATGEQDSKGSLAPGTVADMVVLSTDIFSSVEALEQARVVCTIVDGTIAADGL
jgi:predicted amidohydrolase YtcJ